MTANPTILRRVFDVIGLFSFLNLLALAGLVALAARGGALDHEKLQRIAAIMRGDEPAPAGPSDPAATEVSPDAIQNADDAHDLAGESEVNKEVLRREAARIKAELDQRLALNNSILLRVTAERERVARLRDEESKAARIREEQRAADGFRKQVDLFEALTPKVAVQHLMAMSGPDEAARLLVEIDTRKAKKIVEAAKRPEELSQMQLILQRLREVAPDRSTELESED